MGTTIGDVLISYDVNSSHVQVKADMIALGYKDAWKSYDGTRVYDLPNTTLWKNNATSDAAMLDLRRICTNLRVTLEKAVAVKATEFVGI